MRINICFIVFIILWGIGQKGCCQNGDILAGTSWISDYSLIVDSDSTGEFKGYKRAPKQPYVIYTFRDNNLKIIEVLNGRTNNYTYEINSDSMINLIGKESNMKNIFKIDNSHLILKNQLSDQMTLLLYLSEYLPRDLNLSKKEIAARIESNCWKSIEVGDPSHIYKHRFYPNGDYSYVFIENGNSRRVTGNWELVKIDKSYFMHFNINNTRKVIEITDIYNGTITGIMRLVNNNINVRFLSAN